MTITSQYLAISAIFIIGFYLGLKVKQGIYNLELFIKKNYSKKEN